MPSSTIEDDSWKFAAQSADKMHREIGVYGGDVIPGVSVKSATGVARGEELYHRPELHRPWRSSSTQRHAEVMVAKEQEIEVLTKRNTELRTLLAQANRELQKVQLQLKTEIAKLNNDKLSEIENLKQSVQQAKEKYEQLVEKQEHQVRLLRSEHDSELAKLQAKMKTAQDNSNEMGKTYFKQMQEVKNAAAREVELIQQLCHARTAELSNELQSATDSVRRLTDNSSGSVKEMQDEMRRSEERCLEQLRDQEKRFGIMRDTLQRERQIVEAQRDKALSELLIVQEKNKALSYDLSETDTRFKDWNVRLLSDLDQIYEYYAAAIKEAGEGQLLENQRTSKISEVYMPQSAQGDHASRNVMDRIAERLQQLTLMKQQHSTATQTMTRKIRALEGTVASSSDSYQKQAADREMLVSRLQSQVSEAKSRQERMEKAHEETKEMFNGLEGRLLCANARLDFFCKDLGDSLSCSAKISPPSGCVTMVALCVQGATVQFEKDQSVMQRALHMANECIRTKTRQYGGYECMSDGDAQLIAFRDVRSACFFALETQLWLLQLSWPVELLQNGDSKEEISDESSGKALIFRGLRIAMGIHRGEVDLEETNVPTSPNEHRILYHGRTIMQVLHVASIACGGQILLSKEVWEELQKEKSAPLEMQAKPMGDYKLNLPHRASGGEGSFVGSEVMTLHQILPKELAARKFSASHRFDNPGGNGEAISSRFAQFRKMSIEAEVSQLKQKYSMVCKAMDTIEDECRGVGSTVESLNCKIRDAQIHGRAYSQADLVAHVAALDRVLSRTEIIKGDLQRTTVSQSELQRQMKSLEDVLIVNTKVTMNEDEFKRRIEVVHDRCNEKIYENTLQNEQKLQHVKNSLVRSEQQNTDLKQQVFSGASISVKETVERERKHFEQKVAEADAEIKSLKMSLEKMKSVTKFQNVPRAASSSRKTVSPQNFTKSSSSKTRTR